MRRPFRCLTVMVTNQCPLQCAHCGPRSGPWAKGAVDFTAVAAALDEARARECQVVNFSGGEPFILGPRLAEMVRAAAERGLLPRITTGAYWSPTPEAARKCLQPLVEAGLGQLFISCSDAHRAFVPLGNVVEACRAARGFGIEVYLVLGTSRTSATSSRSVREAFEAAGLAVPWMIESPIIPFGRAEDQLDASELILQPVEDIAGPCPSLTENPTVHTDGRVTGCAVVFGRDCAALKFGDLSREPLGAILDRMDQSPLAAWIHETGVVELKQLIEAHSPIRFADRYVNICHLCGEILSNPQALALLSDLGLLPPGDVTAQPTL